MTTILHRRGVAALWAEINPILGPAEFGVEIDTGKFKIGDGIHRWVDLPYSVGDGGTPPPDDDSAIYLRLDKLDDDVDSLNKKTIGVEEDLQRVVNDLGDPALLTTTHPAHDLVHWLSWLESRVTTLEQAGSPEPPALPVPEFALQVDNYGGGFIRIRDTVNGLADGEVHIVNMVLATQPGPGGAVIDPVAGVPAGSNPVWFDRNGSLGYVDGSTGTHINQTSLRNWVKYSDPATANHYLLWVHLTHAADDASKPLLVIDRVATVA